MNSIKSNYRIYIEKKLDVIAQTILNSNEINGIGLLTGNAGIAILLSNYSKHTGKEKYYNQAISMIEKSIEKINEEPNLHTFCAGISGFLWGLIHLVKNDFLNKEDISGLLQDLDKYLYKKMKNDIETGQYDYLHGAIGVGIYFLERLDENPNARRYLNKLIDELEKISVKDEDGSYKWLSEVDIETGKQAYNLSISHGIASIIAFLGKAYKKEINKVKVKRLLDGSIKYILKNNYYTIIRESYFPNWISETDPVAKSRMAWCYGDLGISVVLYNVGKILQDDILVDFSIKVLLLGSERRDLQKEAVVDAGLCHGTAGIAHIYNRMFFNTGIEKFKETADYWFNETLKMAKFDDGLAGFKAYHTEKYGGWNCEYGILEGIAGIGLAMFSWTNQTEPTWDECLLLS